MLTLERKQILTEAWWADCFYDPKSYCDLTDEEKNFVNGLDDRLAKKMDLMYRDFEKERISRKYYSDPDANGLLVASVRDKDFADSFFTW